MSKEKEAFALNFSNTKKVIRIELAEDDGIFKLAKVFEKLLYENEIKYSVTESEIQE